jgi:hypothetical protein
MWSFRGDSSTSLLPLIQSWYQPVLLYELKANAFVGVSADRGGRGGGGAGMEMFKFMWDRGASFLRVHTSSTVRYMLHPPLQGIESRDGYFFEGLYKIKSILFYVCQWLS